MDIVPLDLAPASFVRLSVSRILSAVMATIEQMLVTALALWMLWTLAVLNAIKGILRPLYSALYATRAPAVIRTPDEAFKDVKELGYDFQVS